MLHPFTELLNCSFNVYQLQLSLYQLALEPIGFRIIGRRIIWLKEDSNYEKINTNSYTVPIYYALITKDVNSWHLFILWKSWDSKCSFSSWLKSSNKKHKESYVWNGKFFISWNSISISNHLNQHSNSVSYYRWIKFR